MPSIVLSKHANPIQLSNTNILDTAKPLDYRAWLNNNIGIDSNDAEKQYIQYLNNWSKTKITNSTLTNYNNKLKADYISLLKRLQLVFKDDPEFSRISKIDFDDQLQLKIAIPLFARKLKEIALY